MVSVDAPLRGTGGGTSVMPGKLEDLVTIGARFSDATDTTLWMEASHRPCHETSFEGIPPGDRF